MKLPRHKEMWDDPYAEDNLRIGKRCKAHWPAGRMFQCVREKGHTGKHRYSSTIDNRSVTWD